MSPSPSMERRFDVPPTPCDSPVAGFVEPVGSSWESRRLPEDQLNFRMLSASMDRLDLEINRPRDR